MNKEDSIQRLKQKNDIIERAKKKDPNALEMIFSNPKDDDFLRFIVVRARTDKGEVGERARDFVYKNQNLERCWNCIVGMALDGNKYAFEIVLKNSDRLGSLKCIASWALKDPRAESFVLQHASDAEYWSYIVNFAKEGACDAIEKVLRNCNRNGAIECIDYVIKQGYFKDLLNKKNESAISFALEHPKYLDSMEYIIDRARKGDKNAEDIVLRNIHDFKFQNKIFKLIQQRDEWAMKKLLQIAKLGNVDAARYILANPQKKEYWPYIVYKAEKGDLKSKKWLFDHCTDNNECLQFVIDWSERGDLNARKKLLELARNGARRVIEFILEKPGRPIYWQFVAEKAQKGDLKYREIVYQHYFDNYICRQAVIDMANSGIESAKKTIMSAVEKDINIWGGKALSCVIKLALNEDSDAKKFVLSNVDNPLCKQCAVKLAEEDKKRVGLGLPSFFEMFGLGERLSIALCLLKMKTFRMVGLAKDEPVI